MQLAGLRAILHEIELISCIYSLHGRQLYLKYGKPGKVAAWFGHEMFGGNTLAFPHNPALTSPSFPHVRARFGVEPSGASAIGPTADEPGERARQCPKAYKASATGIPLGGLQNAARSFSDVSDGTNCLRRMPSYPLANNHLMKTEASPDRSLSTKSASLSLSFSSRSQ